MLKLVPLKLKKDMLLFNPITFILPLSFFILENLSITIQNNNYNQKAQGFKWITGNLKGHKSILYHLDAFQDMGNERNDIIF